MPSYQDFINLENELEIKNARIATLEEALSSKNAHIKSLSETLSSNTHLISALEESLSITIQSKNQTISTFSTSLANSSTTISLQNQIITVKDKLLQHHKDSNAQLIAENEQLREEVRMSKMLANNQVLMVQLQRLEMRRINEEGREETAEMLEQVTGLVVGNEELRGLVSALQEERERLFMRAMK